MAGPGRDWTAAFAADLHLQVGDTAGIERAVELLKQAAAHTRQLFLLGDVFDLWPSAVMLELPELQALYQAFRDTTRAGLRIEFLPGNRDFNLTPAVGRELGMEVGGEALEREFEGRRLYLCHGDGFLLRDTSYQRYKRFIRSRPLRFLARHLPRSVALGAARRLRSYSGRVVQGKDRLRLSIVPEAVEAALRRGNDWVLCGHVHRAERVRYPGGGELFVLPAFLEEARFAVLREGHLQLADLAGGLTAFPEPVSAVCSAPPPG